MTRIRRYLGFVLFGVISVTSVLSMAGRTDAQDVGRRTPGSGGINEIKLVANHCNVNFESSKNGKLEYDYDGSKFQVTSKVNGSVITISTKGKDQTENSSLKDRIIIRLPKDTYKTISVNANHAGVSLPKMNVNYNLESKEGALSVSVPNGYSKTLNYKLTNSAGSIDFNSKANHFKLQLTADGSAVSVPKGWPSFHFGSTYKYKKGKGTGTINIQAKDSSFAITQANK
ncbi:DUF4097 family beta strand repeat-containing protein [Paenibacillus sp. J22TS3]|uniref:DUF4097 family beta strand repeat-containing protein n=1 Tax=Paenibacillus sp. J22TS3 TaxID=2807192 RepID=UPI001B244A40|nr:DUF4097 family beta strand repeat-containing protein [Paenibacillus sp. J22TS3]GIP24493.1 hypothetical protein J22TS3_47680 [Paenibacillus sp. J22TS3]